MVIFQTALQAFRFVKHLAPLGTGFFPLALALSAAPLVAQDVTIGAPVTYVESYDNHDCKPLALLRSPKPKYPAELRRTDAYNYAIAFSPTIDEWEQLKSSDGAPIRVSVGSFFWQRITQREIESPCLEAFRGWKWDAAALDANDPRRAWVPIIFNPPSASATKKDAAPRLLDVVPVFVPSCDYISPKERLAQAAVTVGPGGEIKTVKLTSANQFALEREAAVVEAVSKWKIAPGRAKGVPTEATINVPVLFLPGSSMGKTNPESFTQLISLRPVNIASPSPRGQQIRKSSRVTLEFTLDNNGTPQNPVVVLSTDKECDAPALKAIRKYRFQKPDPTKPDSLGNICANPSDARWQYDITYSSVPAFRDESGNIQDAPMSYGENVRRPVLPPESVETVAPVYPYHLLKENVTGSATVRMPCTIDSILSDDAEVINASKDEFGDALAAAMYFYKVTPKTPKGKTTASMLTVTFDFNPANPELRLSEKTKQLLADETNAPAKIIPADKLDNPLKIRKDATCPEATNEWRLKSTVTAEFLVDETGHVHLPRIIKADYPYLGYLFVQQLSMRVYDPPLQNGKPVVARARETTIFPQKKTTQAPSAGK